jgi:hypothetical protein
MAAAVLFVAHALLHGLGQTLPVLALGSVVGGLARALDFGPVVPVPPVLTGTASARTPHSLRMLRGRVRVPGPRGSFDWPGLTLRL